MATNFSEDIIPLVFTQAVEKGLMDIEEGREISLEDVKKRFGLK